MISASKTTTACLPYQTACTAAMAPSDQPFGLCAYKYNNICRACMMSNGMAGQCSDQVFVNQGERYLLCLSSPQVCNKPTPGGRMIAGSEVSDTTFYGSLAAGAAIAGLLVAAAVTCVRNKKSIIESELTPL